jgi:hypothetical protein
LAIDALPTPPSTTDPENFDARADGFLGALPTFGTQANALAAQVSADAATAAAAKTAAATSEANAEASAAAAAAGASGLQATSSTSATIQTSAGVDVSITIQTGKSFAVGHPVKMSRTSDGSKYHTGDVKSYNSGTGALVITTDGGFGGSGTFSDWTIIYYPSAGLAAAVDDDFFTASPSAQKAVTVDAEYDALAGKEITYGVSLTWAVATAGFSPYVNLTGNVTSVGPPDVLIDNMYYEWTFAQDGTGGRTVTGWDSIYDFGAAGVPDIATGSNAITSIGGRYKAFAGKILMNHRQGA